MNTKTLSPYNKAKRKSAAQFHRVAALSTGPYDSLMANFQAANISGANSIIQAISPTTWLPVSSDSLGPINFYWQNGSLFNQKTWEYINNLFAYDQTNNNYYTNADDLNTALYNVFSSISYVLSSNDQDAINKANLDNAGDMQTLVSNYTGGGFGTVPSGTTAAQYNAVLSAILGWATPAVSYTNFFLSPDPESLLTNAPAGSDELIQEFIEIVNNMAPVNAIIGAQQAVESELRNLKNNIKGPKTSAAPGWMQLVDDHNNPVPGFVPQWNLNPGPETITSQLEATANFQVSMSVTEINNDTCNVSVNGGAAVSVGVGFLGIDGSTSGSYDLSTICDNITEINITMQFNGVTNISMVPDPYDLSTSAGWWLPDILSQAVNNNPAVSGPYMPPSAYNFMENGTFGVLNNLFISQFPLMTINFSTAKASDIDQIFKAQSSWGVDFLGIDFGGGSSSSTYTSDISNFTSSSITITMAPPLFPSKLNQNDQTAYVIGGSLTWPGAA